MNESTHSSYSSHTSHTSHSTHARSTHPVTLRITEIFLSLQGESSSVGLPTVFVRLTGCPLRCQYCDTAYAFSGGELRSVEDIVAQVVDYGVGAVTVTGGEPLAQANCLPLLEKLCDRGYRVSLETSGALDVSQVDARVIKVLDLKTPGSGEVGRNCYENLQHLQAHDEVKFVICDRADYEWSRMACERYGLFNRATPALFSASADQLAATELADWIVSDRLGVRYQVQLHKILWQDEPGR